MTEEKCICQHVKTAHNPEYWKNKMWSNATYMKDACYFQVSSDGVLCSCIKFKLDNLKLVEDLAKERNLI